MVTLREIIRHTFNRMGYDVCKSYRFWIKPPQLLDLAIRSIQHGDFFFIQVGANDGISYDPIRPYILEYKWKGILVEPQKQMFQSLITNYKDSQHLAFENCAITNADGPINMFRPKQTTEGAPEPDTLATLRPSQLDGELERETVPGMTLLSLLRKHNVQHVDFLQIDAEWFDDQIVRQALGLPESLKPRLMHFESDWMPSKQAIALYQELTRQEYRVFHGRKTPEHDTLAIRQSLSNRQLRKGNGS